MKGSRRYAWVGLFVVGALLIAAVGAALFFGGGFGRATTRALMVFRGNVTGLEVGTPVQFRGMKIGEVKRVRTIYDPDSKQVLFPVYAEFTGVIEIPGYENRAGSAGIRSAWIAEMVDRGLRAQLQTKSFVTGQQMIMLDFVTDDGPQLTKIEKDILEIPTARSPNEAIVDALRELPVRQIVFEGQKLIEYVNGLMQDVNGRPGPLPRMIEQFAETGQLFKQAVPQLSSELRSAAQELKLTLAQTRSSLAAFSRATNTFDQQAVRLSDGLSTTLTDVQTLSRALQQSAGQAEQNLSQSMARVGNRLEESLVRLDRSLSRLDFSLSDDSTTGAALNSSLNEAARAAQALRQAVDALNRRPNNLLFGHPSEPSGSPSPP